MTVTPQDSASRRRTFLRLLAWVFPLQILYLIVRNGHDAVFWDEWDMFRLYQEYYEGGGPHLATLFGFHNEHRIFWTRLLFLTDQALFNGARLPMMLVTFAVMVVAVVFLARRLATPLAAQRPTAYRVLIVLMAALLFSPTMMNIWWWAFNIQHPICFLFFTLSVFTFADRRRTTGIGTLLLALFWGICSTFASGVGLLIWPTLALMSFFVPGRAPWRDRAILLVTAVVVLALYLPGFPRSGGGSPAHPGGIGVKVQFFLAFLGGILGMESVTVATIFGAVGTVLLLWQISTYLRLWRADARRGGEDTNANEQAVIVLRAGTPWMFLLAYPVGNALLASLGRAERYGLEEAITSRYTLCGAAFWVALAVGAVLLHRQQPAARMGGGRERAVRIGVVLAIGAAFLCFFRTHYLMLTRFRAYQTDIRYAWELVRLRAYMPNYWRNLYPDVDRLTTLLEFYRRHGMKPFDAPGYAPLIGRSLTEVGIRVSEKPDAGSFEALAPLAPPPARGPNPEPPAGYWLGIEVFGWGWARQHRIDAVLIADDRQVIRGIGITELIPRPEIAAALHDPRASYAGWRGAVDTSGLTPGVRLRAYAYDSTSHKAYPLEGIQEVRITP